MSPEYARINVEHQKNLVFPPMSYIPTMAPTNPRSRARLQRKHLTPSTRGRIIGRHIAGSGYGAISKAEIVSLVGHGS